MQLKLTDEEMQEVYRIAENCAESVERLYQRLEMLTWGDGLLEFRMQGGHPLAWMDQTKDLSDRINVRLQAEGIPFGPALEAYEEIIRRQSKTRKETCDLDDYF
ncbi:MAG: hypothetical protein WA939_18880 [Nodosilinea sp.]